MSIPVLFKRPIAIAIGLAALGSLPSIAQDTASSIRGKVVDSSGNPNASVIVVVTDTRTGITRSYTTNSSGSFFASGLPVGGPYEVSVAGGESISLDSLSLGDTYNLTLDGTAGAETFEEVIVLGQALNSVNTATGPTATFNLTDMLTSVAFDRDIKDVYRLDPRMNIDNPEGGSAVNCAGKHPRFNSNTVDGVSHNDRFGLNSNGYSTASGMPYPFDGIEQVAVELAPFDVTYGGFSGCNINAVTKSGSNEWEGSVFYEFTNDNLRGDTLSAVEDFGGADVEITSESYKEEKKGFSFRGPLLQDKLFIAVAYEESESPEFIAQGYDGSGNGEQRDWLSESDFNSIADIAETLYGYDAGGQPSDGAQTDEKYMIRADWNINDSHNAALIYNYYDGSEDRASDSDSYEFEFANHFYTKGSESETYTFILNSQWSDSWSTQLYLNKNEMIDSQVTVGDTGFAEVQISVGDNIVYLGADDSRQANQLNYDSTFLKVTSTHLIGDHVVTAGYERDELNVFNLFVQHSAGGEIRFFDDSATGGLSGIEKFELGLFDQYYYGSGGGTNNADDAAASYSNVLNTLYLQDELFLDNYDLSITFGLRYDFFQSDDTPTFNQAFYDATGVRNDTGVDGLDILMPRIGFTWDAADDMTVRGGIGLYSGGNPNVWIANAWSNDGISNAQVQCNPGDTDDNDCGWADTDTLFGLSSEPGYSVPSDLTDLVSAISLADGSTSNLAIIDPNYEQPSEWKTALGATFELDKGFVLDADILYSKTKDAAYYVDISQQIVGYTTTGQPIYDYIDEDSSDNFMLTNSSNDAESLTLSFTLSKSFDNGLDLMFGYAHTDAEDISPMTSSTAESNFENVALLDIKNVTAGTSNYEVANRFTFQARYAQEFFDGLETRFTLTATAKDGQGQSYVMDGRSLEGDGYYGRHLLYVPDGLTDANVVFDSGFDSDAFFAWVDDNDLTLGQYVGRNETKSKMSSRVDFRFDQEIPTFVDGTHGNLFLKIYNLGNLIDDKYGHQYDAEFFSQEVVNASVNDDGQYVFESFTELDVDDLLQSSSFWEARLGVEFHF